MVDKYGYEEITFPDKKINSSKRDAGLDNLTQKSIPKKITT